MKTSFGSKKGKDHGMERNDSDEDSLDFDNMEEMREAMAKIQKEDRAKKPLLVSVSPGVANVAEGCTKYICSFPKPGKIFYAKAAFFRRLITIVTNKKKLLHPEDDYAQVDT